MWVNSQYSELLKYAVKHMYFVHSPYTKCFNTESYYQEYLRQYWNPLTGWQVYVFVYAWLWGRGCYKRKTSLFPFNMHEVNNSVVLICDGLSFQLLLYDCERTSMKMALKASAAKTTAISRINTQNVVYTVHTLC